MVCEQPIAPESSGVEWGQAIMPPAPVVNRYFSRNRKMMVASWALVAVLSGQKVTIIASQETSAHGPRPRPLQRRRKRSGRRRNPKAALRGYVHTNKFGVPVQESDNLLPGGRSLRAKRVSVTPMAISFS